MCFNSKYAQCGGDRVGAKFSKKSIIQKMQTVFSGKWLYHHNKWLNGHYFEIIRKPLSCSTKCMCFNSEYAQCGLDRVGAKFSKKPIIPKIQIVASEKRLYLRNEWLNWRLLSIIRKLLSCSRRCMCFNSESAQCSRDRFGSKFSRKSLIPKFQIVPWGKWLYLRNEWLNRHHL